MSIDSIKTFSMQPVALAQRAAAYDLADDEVRAAAERAAASVRRLAASSWLQIGPRDELVLKTLHRMAQGYGVRHPNKAGAQQWFNRMTDPAWWRRALRSRFRDVELHQIRKGAVHRQAGRYVSDKAMRRFERNKTYMAGLLSSLDLVNQTTGEVLPLQDVVISGCPYTVMPIEYRVTGADGEVLVKRRMIHCVMAPHRPLATQPPNSVSARFGNRYCRETARDMGG